MSILKRRSSDIALLLGLAILLSLVRFYYGGDHGLMVVWKGQPDFADTVVNLSEIQQMPIDQLRREHPSVHWQLVAMDIIDDNTELDAIRERAHRQQQNRTGDRPAPQAGSEDSGS